MKSRVRTCEEGHSVKYLDGNIQDKRWFRGRNHCAILATLIVALCECNLEQGHKDKRHDDYKG